MSNRLHSTFQSNIAQRKTHWFVSYVQDRLDLGNVIVAILNICPDHRRGIIPTNDFVRDRKWMVEFNISRKRVLVFQIAVYCLDTMSMSANQLPCD